MEENGIIGLWVNTADSKEEILITDIGGDEYYLEFEKNENGFRQKEKMIFYLSEYPRGLFESEHYGRDESAYCDGQVLRINDKVFKRKTEE